MLAWLVQTTSKEPSMIRCGHHASEFERYAHRPGPVQARRGGRNSHLSKRSVLPICMLVVGTFQDLCKPRICPHTGYASEPGCTLQNSSVSSGLVEWDAQARIHNLICDEFGNGLVLRPDYNAYK